MGSPRRLPPVTGRHSGGRSPRLGLSAAPSGLIRESLRRAVRAIEGIPAAAPERRGRHRDHIVGPRASIATSSTREPATREDDPDASGPKDSSTWTRVVIVRTFGLRVGDPYTREAVRDGVRRLYQSGLYTDVNVADAAAGDGVALTVVVQERVADQGDRPSRVRRRSRSRS